MICDSPLFVSVGIGSQYPRIKDALYDNVKEVFRRSDIVIGNFETVVHEPKNKSLKEKQMTCSEEAIKALRDSGVNVLNLANNHCLQHGSRGFESTKRACYDNGISPIGVKDEEPCIIDVFFGGGVASCVRFIVYSSRVVPT